MSRLFGRNVILQLDTFSYTDFRINFRVVKSVSGEPNEGKFQIYGLSRSTTANILFSGRETRVRLFAGYGDSPSLLFDGTPIRDGVSLTKDGPERILEIQALDGIRSLRAARVNISFERSITYGDLVEETLAQMGLPLGVIDRSHPDWTRKLERGATLEGRGADVLDRLAETMRSQWSIQDGKLQFIQEGKARLQRGPRFAPELGNVVNAPKPKDGGGIELTALLYPIQPGDRFQVDGFEDQRYRGVYRADSVVHTGDSGFDSSFYTSIQGTKLPT